MSNAAIIGCGRRECGSLLFGWGAPLCALSLDSFSPFLDHWFALLVGVVVILLAAAALGAYRSRRQFAEYARNLEEMVEARNQALRKSEEHYRRLCENANDIIYTHDLQGNFTSLNRAGEELTGYTQKEACQLNISQVVAPHCLEKARRMIRQKLDGKPQTAYELEIVSNHGKTLTVEVSTRLIREQGEPVAVQGIARDISQRKKLEERLRQSQKMEALGRLAGGVAHDFNNLLMVIQGCSEMLRQSPASDESMHSLIDQIQRATERAAALTQQLLVFSRKHAVEPKPMDLNSVIWGVEKMLRRLIGGDIELSVRLCRNAGRIEADPAQMEQVILNLAVNARDAMPQGGRLSISTTPVDLDGKHRLTPALPSGRYVQLAIRDTGNGMDQETAQQIFEPFFTTKGQGRGTGLGLAAVYGIVRQSGGAISVDSAPGRGSTFKVYLPQVEAQAEAEASALPEGQVRSGHETVLVVEDEDGVRALTKELLRRSGYRVLAAENGSQALQMAQGNGKIALLLTDVVMPGMSGRELAEGFLKINPEAKVLYMSGYTDDAILHHGVVERGTSFLHKPFRHNDLTRKVREVLDR